MAVDPRGISGGASANISPLGSAFGLTDDEFHIQVKTGDHYTQHMGTRQVPVMTEVDMPDGSKKMVPTNQMQNAQQDTIDPTTGKIVSTNVADNSGWDHAPIMKNLGDEVQRITAMAFSSDPGTRAIFEQIQQKLAKGSFASGKLTKGIADNNTVNALTQALKSAAVSGVTLDELLAKDDENATSKKNARSINLTSPTDVRSAIQKLAPQLIGHGVDPATVDKILQGFNVLEANSQNANADAQDLQTLGDGGGTISYNAPNLNNYVNEQLRTADPTAAQGQQLGDFFSQFIGLMGGNGSAASFGGSNG